MRRGHFAMFFGIAFFMCLMTTVLRQFQFELSSKEKERTDTAVLFAADTAANELLGSGMNLSSMLGSAADRFFCSLAVSTNKDVEELMVYVPLLLVTCDDGFYLNILTLDKNMLSRRWTECLSYAYEDDEFLYRLCLNGEITSRKKDTGEIVHTSYHAVQSDSYLMSYYRTSRLFASEDVYQSILQAAVTASIEREMALAMEEESYLVGSIGYGISYTAPSFLAILPENYGRTFAAVYQGFPGVYGVGFSYNGVTAASYTVARNEYLVALPQSTGVYYAVAHHEGCTHLTGSEAGPVDKDTAIRTYGAYACPDCVRDNEGFSFAP